MMNNNKPDIVFGGFVADVDTPHPDKKSIMMYLMCLFQSLSPAGEALPSPAGGEGDVAGLETTAGEEGDAGGEESPTYAAEAAGLFATL